MAAELVFSGAYLVHLLRIGPKGVSLVVAGCSCALGAGGRVPLAGGGGPEASEVVLWT